MDLNTLVKTAAAVQMASVAAFVGVCAYFAHQQKKLSTTIAAGEADLDEHEANMKRWAHVFPQNA